MILGNTLRGGAGRENPNLTMGSQGNLREIKLTDFEINLPIDSDKGVQALKDNMNLYCKILNKFRNYNLIPALN